MWINTSALACNLPDKEPLREATRYTVEIQPGIIAEDGTTIAEAYHAAFITQRPDVYEKEFWQWKAPGYPVVRLVFNQPVDQESVAQHIFLNLGEKNERIALQGKTNPTDHEPPRLLPARRAVRVVI
jgi:hypothetical protein